MARIAIYAYATIVLIAGIFSHAQAAEFEKNILTGGPKGTYIQIGRDMAKLLGDTVAEGGCVTQGTRDALGVVGSTRDVRPRLHRL